MNTKPFTALAAVSLVLLVLPAQATTIHVPDDQPTIQAGVDAASAGDTVLVECGTYYEHDVVMRSGIVLRSDSGLADCVTIDAQYLGRVFYCANVNNATICGMTITRGTTDEFERGGGMYCSGSDLLIVDCLFLDNSAHYGGAGMYCEYSSPTLTSCTFSDNATGGLGDGGGLYCEYSSPTLTDCTFEGNAGTFAGAVFCVNYSSPTLTDCVLSGNSGGGMYCFFSSSPVLNNVTFSNNYTLGMYCGSDCSPVLLGCTFSGNSGRTTGAGMYCGSGSSPVLEGCTFSGNAVSGVHARGGGMFCGTGSSPTLTDVLFSANQAGEGGGGMWCEGASPVLLRVSFWGNLAYQGGGLHCENQAAPILTDCTFSENSAEIGGGAVYCDNSSPTLANVTASGNSSPLGAGMYCSNGSSPVLTNSIIAFGGQGEAVYCYDAGSDPTLTCCDVYGNAGGDWVGCIAGQNGVNGNFSEAPLFCLDDAPDRPYSLHEGSPCLPENSPCGELVGAFGPGCGPVSPVESMSWGAIKVMFR